MVETVLYDFTRRVNGVNSRVGEQWVYVHTHLFWETYKISLIITFWMAKDFGNISGGNHNFVKTRANHGKKSV